MKNRQFICRKIVLLMCSVVVVFSLLLSGCNVETPAQREKRLNPSTSGYGEQTGRTTKSDKTQRTTINQSGNSDTSSTKSSQNNVDKNSTLPSNEGQSADLLNPDTTDRQNSGEKSPDEQKDSQKETKKDNTKETAKNSTQKPESKNINVKISVDCTELFKNTDKISNKYKEQTLPYLGNGTIIKQISVSVKEGNSVFDVLQKQCHDSGIKLDYKKSSMGMYIGGINHIYEKICEGNRGGWTYYVNGKYIYASSDKVKLKDGDVVQWVYSV